MPVRFIFFLPASWRVLCGCKPSSCKSKIKKSKSSRGMVWGKPWSCKFLCQFVKGDGLIPSRFLSTVALIKCRINAAPLPDPPFRCIKPKGSARACKRAQAAGLAARIGNLELFCMLSLFILHSYLAWTCAEYHYVGLLEPKTVPEKPDGFERMSLVANPI